MIQKNSLAKKILVVDDDPNSLETVTTILSKGGYEIHSAVTAQEALLFLQHTLPDLILLDVILPDMSGADLCVTIKNNPSYDEILIVLISGIKISKEDFAYGLEIGADGYLARRIA